MRLSTLIKRKYQKQGVTVLRAIQDDCMIRLTVPNGTPRLTDEVRRSPAFILYPPGESKTRSWVWIWSGAPDWEDNIERCKV
jgi:hypothetical protein